MIAQISNTVGGGLDKLMNLVPTSGKVTILPVSQYDPIPIPSGLPYTAMFNPDEWTESEKAVYVTEQPIGSIKPTIKFHVERPKS